MRKNLSKTYKRESFLTLEKDVLFNNFGTTEQIQLILVPLDQKLGELTHKIFNYSEKSKRKKFLRLILAVLPISEGRPIFTFCETFR